MFCHSGHWSESKKAARTALIRSKWSMNVRAIRSHFLCFEGKSSVKYEPMTNWFANKEFSHQSREILPHWMAQERSVKRPTVTQNHNSGYLLDTRGAPFRCPFPRFLSSMTTKLFSTVATAKVVHPCYLRRQCRWIEARYMIYDSHRLKTYTTRNPILYMILWGVTQFSCHITVGWHCYATSL